MPDHLNSPNPYQPPASLEPPLAERDADETEPGDELAPSSREDDAARAFKSAILGLFFCPLQLYTAWLLFLVLVNDEPLRTRYFWYAVGAAVVLIPYAALFGLLSLFYVRY
ncbi:MAG: hypothetical protein L0211_16955 [Planctomycetaceae bacterium]|nr:hypothetical protein [Planctomycetaceae bacterium]